MGDVEDLIDEIPEAVEFDERRRLEVEGWDGETAFIAVKLRFEGPEVAAFAARLLDRIRRE